MIIYKFSGFDVLVRYIMNRYLVIWGKMDFFVNVNLFFFLVFLKI